MDTQVSQGDHHQLSVLPLGIFCNVVLIFSSDLIVGAFGVNKAVLYRYDVLKTLLIYFLRKNL